MSVLARLVNPLHPLPVAVKVEAPPGGMSPDFAAQKNMHACHEAVLITIWKPMVDGATQHVQQPMSYSGIHGGPLSAVEMFRVWAVLAFDLMQRKDLDPELRAVAMMVNASVDGPLNPKLATMLIEAEKANAAPKPEAPPA